MVQGGSIIAELLSAYVLWSESQAQETMEKLVNVVAHYAENFSPWRFGTRESGESFINRVHVESH